MTNIHGRLKHLLFVVFTVTVHFVSLSSSSNSWAQTVRIIEGG